MLTSPNPSQDAVTTTIESVYGTAQLPSRKSNENPKDRLSPIMTDMNTSCRIAEPSHSTSTPTETESPAVLRLQALDRKRVPNEGGDDEISTVTDGLLSDRRPSTSLPTPATTSRTAGALFSLPAHPLFPPLPIYEHPPKALDTLKYLAIRGISFVLSLLFLLVVVIGALFRGGWVLLVSAGKWFRGKTPQRRFYEEEQARRLDRRTSSRRWKLRQEKREVDEEVPDDCPPLEGGKDPVVGDVAYYARRVGLDVETFKVETEDGFILTLWHVYNPQEYAPLPASERGPRGPYAFNRVKDGHSFNGTRRKYPVLLMHGLLQNSGAYCANDDDSLAFFLCKSGYDVWLGNNRCGLEPEHTSMLDSDPRMWSWTIQHMGAFDVTGLTSRVLYETGYEKLGLVCHSQGTAQTFVALAKSQRPELGDRISVFCALAPAVYAGPLVERIYFRFMRLVSPAVFRLIFGIHSFIPFMVTVRGLLHARIYGTLGYIVFSYLFNWSDSRWDKGLRDRMFQFAPVYVSSETIRWWLGAEGFSTHQCILENLSSSANASPESNNPDNNPDTAWYGPHTPPLALWIGGNDKLVDGCKLLARLQSGREPHVTIAHAKVIEGYEHLDVLWAMDMIEQVGSEVRQVLWETMGPEARRVSVVPRGVG
ncbi:putative ab-hydrolase associated lipase [Aspergillus undulatus]|uniref:putative ab-hydrolase associated lipase n=1 Tax=Aspergillus undulatus TaxID=1810928 RepID=UPI003CCE3421